MRGSTDEQLNTLEAQENQIRAYCTYKHLELVRVYPRCSHGPVGRSSCDKELRGGEPATGRWLQRIIDKGESGSTSFYERPAACEMLAWIGRGRARHSVRAARL